jgi:hypothetical protein
MMLADDSSAKNENAGSSQKPAREDERGDVAGRDAPTAEEENEGMSTILNEEPVTGVQTDASSE